MPRADDYMLTAEELRLRKRKRFRLMLVLLIVLVIGCGLYFSTRPTLNGIKAWQARRHAQKALALIDAEKWNDARAEAVAAYQLWPAEPQAIRSVARLLSRLRQANGLDFWKQLEQHVALSRQDLRDEASLALAIGDIVLAQSAANGLLREAEGGPAPVDWLLAAQVAAQKSLPAEALPSLQKVFDDPRATEREQLQAAVLKLGLTSGADAPALQPEQQDAWRRITTIARGKTATSLDALTLLTRHALSLPPAPPSNAEPVPSIPELVQLLETHPLAKAPHKLLALDLQMHADAAQREALIERAISEWKNSAPEDLAVLAQWLNSKQEFQRQLDNISLDRALQNRDLFLQYLDALGALARWDEIKQLLVSERFPLDPVVASMYLARCNAQLGEKTASENNWARALEAARSDPGKLLTLADYAEKNGAAQVAETAFTEAARQMPKLRVAQQGRLRIAQASGDTKKIHAVLAEMLSLWPNDTAIQNDEAYTRLLMMTNGGTSSVSSLEGERRTPNVERPTPNEESGGTAAMPSKAKENAQGSTLNAQRPTPNGNGGTSSVSSTARDGTEAIPPSELAAIEQIAAKLVEREPASLPHRTLLALARLRQNRAADALRVYEQINVPRNVLTPSALAIHAAVLAANGQNEDARTEAKQVPLDKLLPEERALLQELL